MTYTYGMAKAYQEQLVRESETGQGAEHLGSRAQGSLRELLRNSPSPFAPLHLQRKPSGGTKTAI